MLVGKQLWNNKPWTVKKLDERAPYILGLLGWDDSPHHSCKDKGPIRKRHVNNKSGARSIAVVHCIESAG